MNEKTKTWLMATGVAAALAFAALIFFLHPGIVRQAGIKGDDLGGGVLAAVIVWLALLGRKGLSQRARLVLGVAVCAVLLLGCAVFFMA
jgi:hypothetical protein